MKKTLLVGLAIGLVSVAATSVFAGPSTRRAIPAQGIPTTVDATRNFGGAGIVGSSHDLSNVGQSGASAAAAGYASGAIAAQADRQSRICVYCHHPHNADAATGDFGGVSGTKAGIGSYSPLWNRNLSTTTFAPYNNGSMMDSGTGSVSGSDKRHVLNAGSNALKGVSLLCMSCHDGVVAMNAYSQQTGSSDGKGANGASRNITGTAGFKGDMSNHHPMGFSYQTVQSADKEIAATSTVMVPSDADIAGGAVTGPLTGTVTIGDLLYGSATGNTFECVTCHDVHNPANATGAERFLWRSNNQSNFCLTCHLK